ncbi:MAG TPA: hypothetical protein VFD92_19725, partial [Candidatus Binatia bacterium]|nr:hypothetical protein [Candidatus Binatia bacterium]
SLPAALRPIAELNPIAGVIGLYRVVVLGMPMTSTTPLVSMLVALVASWLIGALLLARLEGFLDEYW